MPPRERWLARCNTQPARWLSIFALLLAAQISAWWYATPDGTVYLSMARSLATRGELTNLGSAQLGYPPGYPLLVSPAFLGSERPFLLLSAMHWLFAVALMLGVYCWARKQLPAAALLVTGLVLVNVSLWSHYRRTLSEVPFMAVMIWAVIALNTVVDGLPAPRALRAAMGSALLLVLLAMIREVGCLLAMGLAVTLLLTARARQAPALALAAWLVAALPAGLAVAAFVQHDRTMVAQAERPQGTHVAGFTGLPITAGERVSEGTRLRISEIGRLLIPGMFKAYGDRGDWHQPSVVAYSILLPLIVLGWWRFVRTRPEVLGLTLPIYVGVYALWPFDAGTRYLLPMLPALWACVWFAIAGFNRWRLSLMAGLLVLHLSVALGHWVARDLPWARACNAQWPSVVALAMRVEGARPIAADGVPDCVALMFALALDQRLGRSNGPADDASVEWIVTTTQRTAPPGFAQTASDGDLVLLHRQMPSGKR